MRAREDLTPAAARHGVVHRCGGHPCPPGGCQPDSECDLDRMPTGAGHQPRVPGTVYQTLATPGRPMDPAVRRTAQARFGADFSGVRVHTDGAAASSARDVDAHAYTVGEHVVFGTGRYDPHSAAGRHILAHELTHVLQQRAAGPASGGGLRVSDPADADERQADVVADSVLSRDAALPAGPAASVGAHGVARLAREVDDETADQADLVESAAGYADTGPQDGDSPPGGPILPVPTSPEELAQTADWEDESSGLVGRLQRQRGGAPPPNRTHRPIPDSRSTAYIESIEIDLENQIMFIHWSDRRPVQEAQISSGRGRPCTAGDPCTSGNNTNCTPTGNFFPTFRGDAQYTNSSGAHMSWYVDLGVTDAAGVDRGIGIHDAQPVTGSPASHGCVRVIASVARTINENVTTGTMVHIRGKAPTVAWRDRTCPPRRGRH